MRLVPSSRKKQNQDCEREPCTHPHKSVLHTHGMTTPEGRGEFSNRLLNIGMIFLAWLELGAGVGAASG
jgi:hypothetical protein